MQTKFLTKDSLKNVVFSVFLFNNLIDNEIKCSDITLKACYKLNRLIMSLGL